VDEVVVERVRDAEGDRYRDERDDHPRAKLVQVLDERRLLAGAQAPR
jgi:hypothetical protein